MMGDVPKARHPGAGPEEAGGSPWACRHSPAPTLALALGPWGL